MIRFNAVLWSIGLAALTAPAVAQPKATARTLPALELVVPDSLVQPVVVRGTFQPRTYATGFAASPYATAKQPDFVLRLPRDFANLRVHLFGADGSVRAVEADAYRDHGANHAEHGRRYRAGDWAMWLSVRAEAKGSWSVVVWDGDKTVIDPTMRYGQPADAAPIEQRYLASYVPYFVTAGCGAPTAANARLAHQLFTSLPRSFFVFPTQPLRAGDPPPAPGEPLLIMNSNGNSGYVLSSDGVCHSFEQRMVTTEVPAALRLPPSRALKIVPGKHQNDRWTDEDFLAFAAPDVVTAYKAKKQAAQACYDAAWDKLDPDHNAGRFAVATSQGGKLTKIEDLTTKFDRIASAKCKTQVLWSHRDKLEQAALADLANQRNAWRAAVEAHLIEIGFAIPARAP